MKKFLVLLLIILASATVLAGDVPESLLSSDEALIFFGEVVTLDADDNITVLPTAKIKGDVKIGVEQVYKDGMPLGADEFTPKQGEIYLMTYYDEHNPLYVFEITGTDTKTLKIKGLEGLDMWDRLQNYLNNGKYEEAEAERLWRISTSPPETAIVEPPPMTPYSTPAPENSEDSKDYYVYGAVTIIAIAVALYGLKIRNRKV